MYTLTNTSNVLRDDGTIIPASLDNSDWVEYQRWLADGNTPAPIPEPSIEEKKAAINTQRDIDLLQAVMLNGHLFHTDDAFRADLTDMIMGYDKGILTAPTQKIRTRDNQIVDLTPMDLVTLKLTIGMMRQQVFAQSWAQKDALDVQTS